MDMEGAMHATWCSYCKSTVVLSVCINRGQLQLNSLVT